MHDQNMLEPKHVPQLTAVSQAQVTPHLVLQQLACNLLQQLCWTPPIWPRPQQWVLACSDWCMQACSLQAIKLVDSTSEARRRSLQGSVLAKGSAFGHNKLWNAVEEGYTQELWNAVDEGYTQVLDIPSPISWS